MKITRIAFIILFLSAWIWNVHGSDFKPPALTEYRINLVERAKLGTIADRVAAINECGVSRPAVCYYALIELLQDESPVIREKSALALGMLRNKDAIKHIDIALGKENDLNAQTSMIRALQLFRSAAATKIAERYLDNESEKIRFVAIKVYISLPQEENYDLLKGKLSAEKSPLIKVMLMHALLKIKSTDDYIKDLVAYLYDSDRTVRLYTGKATADLKIKETLKPLKIAVLLESDALVREEFLRAYEETFHK